MKLLSDYLNYYLIIKAANWLLKLLSDFWSYYLIIETTIWLFKLLSDYWSYYLIIETTIWLLKLLFDYWSYYLTVEAYFWLLKLLDLMLWICYPPPPWLNILNASKTKNKIWHNCVNNKFYRVSSKKGQILSRRKCKMGVFGFF